MLGEPGGYYFLPHVCINLRRYSSAVRPPRIAVSCASRLPLRSLRGSACGSSLLLHFCTAQPSCLLAFCGASLKTSVPRWRMRSVHHSYGFEIVADPFSVKRDSSSTSLALARFTDSSVVSTQPDPRFSHVSTLPLCISSSCCCMLACSCLHQATKRPRADVARLPSM